MIPTLNNQIEIVTLALAQFVEQRELQLSTRASELSINKWDELILRRKTQFGSAEYVLHNAETTMQKVEALCASTQ